MLPWHKSPVLILSILSAVGSGIVAGSDAARHALENGSPTLLVVTAALSAVIGVIDAFTTTGKIGKK
jgi:hypothetical protein